MTDEAPKTFEDLKHCPKCDQPGEETKSIPAPGAPRGTTLKTIYCRNDLCKWFNTMWLVQVNPDGSVPGPTDHSKRPKLYTGFEGHDKMAAQIKGAMEADAAAALLKGSEIRRRR